MTRFSLPISVALAASAAVLVTACGGGGTDDSGTVQSSRTASATVTPAATPTASGSVGRPEITLPAGARNVFEGQHTGDAKKDAVLYDNSQWVNSMDAAIFQGSLDSTAVGFYSKDRALEGAVTFIKGYLDSGDTWVGTTRFFDREVTFASDGSAAVIYCSDETKAFLKDRKTGKVDNTPNSANSYVLYNTRLEQNDLGVWQTVSVVSDRGAGQCQP